ncbi:MAG: HRDC domain-containing protein [Pirellulaceae bacterium]|nr:HRDC domain-containing protein [Pirellulaceae bacterium]
MVHYELIDRDEQLPAVLQTLQSADLLGLDTEFIAEDSFKPDLCLLQIATRKRIFLIDAIRLSSLDELWRCIVDPSRVIVVHAGREEILFAYRATNQTFRQLFDVQLAMGMLGGEYPAAYGKLLQRLLGENATKGETRTDWRRRPLSTAQLEYAALDVLHLPQLYDLLTGQLQAVNRTQWLSKELEVRQAGLVEYERAEGWTRFPGVQKLTGRQMAIARCIWQWREERAKHKNMPARRVLRDDLIIELARRGSADQRRIAHIRGLHHSGFQRFLPEIAQCIEDGLSGPVPDTPWSSENGLPRPPVLLQQFLTAAMSYLCRTHGISPAIVGTSDDVSRLAAYWLKGQQLPPDDPRFPNLLRGWRAEMVGNPLYEIYCGKRSLYVHKPGDEMPLALCDV